MYVASLPSSAKAGCSIASGDQECHYLAQTLIWGGCILYILGVRFRSVTCMDVCFCRFLAASLSSESDKIVLETGCDNQQKVDYMHFLSLISRRVLAQHTNNVIVVYCCCLCWFICVVVVVVFVVVVDVVVVVMVVVAVVAGKMLRSNVASQGPSRETSKNTNPSCWT